LRLALVSAGARLAALATVPAFMLFGMRGNIFGIWATGSRPVIDLAIVGWRFACLFLLLSGCHNISTSFPSIEATDMPFAGALM
jgi:hypothetical protein